MMQHHLNASRRKGLKQPSQWPDGPNGAGENRSTEQNTTFRGGGLPPEHLGFYKALAKSQQVYRVPGLLATSFQRRVAHQFMERAGTLPKVVWHVKLKDPDQLTGGCKHVNFLEQTAFTTEKEFLFSAYSAFRVLKVKESDNPYKETTPHEIFIEACRDNTEVPENVPSAPWY